MIFYLFKFLSFCSCVLQIKILNLNFMSLRHKRAKLIWSVLAYLFNYWSKNKQTFSIQYKKLKMTNFIFSSLGNISNWWKSTVALIVVFLVFLPLHFVDCFSRNLFPFCNNEPVSFIYLFTVQEKAEGRVWESNILKWHKFNKWQRAELRCETAFVFIFHSVTYTLEILVNTVVQIICRKWRWTEVAALSWETMCIW